MDGKAALNLLKDRRILIIIVAVIIIVAAVAVVVLTGDDDGGSQDPSDGLTITGEQTFSEDRLVEGTLTIQADGKLTLTDGAEIRMLGPNAKIDVQGTLDASHGRISFVTQNEDGTYTEVNSNGADESRAITVSGNGEMIVEGNNFESTGHFDDSIGIRAFVNAATYDAEPNVHITTLARALAATVDVTIRGTLSDNTAVTADKDAIIVDAGARATLGNITLTNGGAVEALGTITANVTSSGSTVGLSGVSGLTVTSSGSFAIDGKMTGSLTVSAGTVYVDNVDATAGTVTVAQNATMAFQKTDALGGVMLIGGGDNSFVINGIVTVGTQPTELPVTGNQTNVGFSGTEDVKGNVKTNPGGFIKVYAGTQSTVSGDHTAFNVDGDLYMTAYGSATIASVLASENVNSEIVADATAFRNVANWNDTENMSGTAVTAETAIGATEFGTVHFATVKVELTVALPTGGDVLLQIDDVTVTGNSITLAAGEHDVKILADTTGGKDYVVKLDGATVDGTMNVTSSSKAITVEEVTQVNPTDPDAGEE